MEGGRGGTARRLQNLGDPDNYAKFGMRIVSSTDQSPASSSVLAEPSTEVFSLKSCLSQAARPCSSHLSRRPPRHLNMWMQVGLRNRRAVRTHRDHAPTF